MDTYIASAPGYTQCSHHIYDPFWSRLGEFIHQWLSETYLMSMWKSGEIYLVGTWKLPELHGGF